MPFELSGAANKPSAVTREQLELARLRAKNARLRDGARYRKKAAVLRSGHAAGTISSVHDSFGRDTTWQFFDAAQQTESLQHMPKFFCLDLRVQFEAALGGVGVALLPESIVRSALLDGKLGSILDARTSIEDAIHAVYPARRGVLPFVHAFLEHLPQALSISTH